MTFEEFSDLCDEIEDMIMEDCPHVCSTCCHCVYIGEGDYICDLSEPVLVMEDFCPNDNHIYCGLADWEEQ